MVLWFHENKHEVHAAACCYNIHNGATASLHSGFEYKQMSENGTLFVCLVGLDTFHKKRIKKNPFGDVVQCP